KNNETKQPKSIKPTTKLVNKVAACPKDNKLETNSPATSPEPLVKEPLQTKGLFSLNDHLLVFLLGSGLLIH
ncbi:MAG: hypothetical protein LN561_02810, partial [Rickettsia endosymbiont of Labidopullus appendiculatus]|nr:hypothetical protein [Rickettsia endosymbiont of Labidopullus appendiculatus]